jgi:hypothetical protein
VKRSDPEQNIKEAAARREAREKYRSYMQFCIVCVRENMLLATIDLTEEDDI